MSKINRQSNDFLSKESWINEITNNTKLAKTLTEEYANDVLESVADEYFPTLDSAIADLKNRIGLTASESDEIKKVCVAMVKSVNAPIEKVAEDKKAWFQGSKDVPKEDATKVVSNDPEALGYSNEVKYDKKPMETTAPKGEDTRPWEQSWFEASAKETKKDLGPAGDELALKKKLQRAQRRESLKTIS